MKSISSLVAELKNNNQDLDFYPTTTEIINIIKKSIDEDNCSILDCGAGNGNALNKLTNGKKYAIEKSQILIKEMNPDIFIVGCDFHENSLIDKKVDVVFCNPPYFEYVQWATKIINESNAKEIYLVIPERWKNKEEILYAIKDRGASFEIIGNTDFLEADRPARAKVDIVKINLQQNSRHYYSNTSPDIDPFELWVEKEFPLNSRKNDEAEENFTNKINELVPGRGLVPVLVELYNNELLKLRNHFKSISELDQSIFLELEIGFNSIVNLLRGRILNLKTKYWRELFKNFTPITERLTTESRKKLLDTLTENISVDFTESNIYSVTIWAIKNANKYFDQQLISVFMGLVEKANLIKYKSNQKTWGKDTWRFRQDIRDESITHYGLDYRCIISYYKTFDDSSYRYHTYRNGIHEDVNNKLNDIITIANNLGFHSSENSFDKDWQRGQEQFFHLSQGEILMAVRAYKNGNIHFKFNQKFLRKLNVEFGRLKGWLRDYKEAAEELNIPELEAKMYFKSNFILNSSNIKLLG